MLTGIGHVAIRCRDIEKSAQFYRDILGMQEAFRMYRDDGSLGTIYLRVGPWQFIELFPDGVEECPVGPETIGVNHMCYRVDDVLAVQEEIRAKGAPIDDPRKTGFSKCVMCWTHDPDGNRIELMETPPESLQAQAEARLSK